MKLAFVGLCLFGFPLFACDADAPAPQFAHLPPSTSAHLCIDPPPTLGESLAYGDALVVGRVLRVSYPLEPVRASWRGADDMDEPCDGSIQPALDVELENVEAVHGESPATLTLRIGRGFMSSWSRQPQNEQGAIEWVGPGPENTGIGEGMTLVALTRSVEGFVVPVGPLFEVVNDRIVAPDGAECRAGLHRLVGASIAEASVAVAMAEVPEEANLLPLDASAYSAVCPLPANWEEPACTPEVGCSGGWECRNGSCAPLYGEGDRVGSTPPPAQPEQPRRR